MSKKTRNIVVTILLCMVGIALIGYGMYLHLNKEVDIVTQAEPNFTDTGEDYNGNPWKLEAYNNEDGKYVMLEVYMEEDHDMKWYGDVASGGAEINYIIYQNDHYAISVNPNLDSGDSELGFIFDKLEPDHSKTATYLYYGLSIINGEEGPEYHVIGGELTDEVTPVNREAVNEDEHADREVEVYELNSTDGNDDVTDEVSDESESEEPTEPDDLEE